MLRFGLPDTGNQLSMLSAKIRKSIPVQMYKICYLYNINDSV